MLFTIGDYSMNFILRVSIIGLAISHIFLNQPCLAFDDDSKIDIALWDQNLGYCEDGRRTSDSSTSKFSCNDDEVFINSNGSLIKNGTVVFNRKPKSFKVSRDGTVFFLYSGKLYREKKSLHSGAGQVISYQISSNGKVIYLNELGDVYQEGKKLDRGADKVRPLNGMLAKIENPAIAVNGDAVYVNSSGYLYKNGKQINPTASRVKILRYSATNQKYFLLDKQGNIFWVSKNGNLFRNSRKVHPGVDPVTFVDLDDNGNLIYLTSGKRNNLFRNGKNINSGGAKVEDFQILRNGSIVYKDSNGRRWKDGKKTQ